MKVFISWSGDRSKALAQILHQWLPAVIQAVKPYFSPDDVAKGARWTTEIASELEESSIGLICLTADNLEAPWIMFEAGALSKNLDKSKVVPLLFDVDPTDIKGPLTQFQAAKFDMSEIKRVVLMINEGLGENSLGPDVLNSVFDMWWPKLNERVQVELKKPEVESEDAIRPDRDLLMEILELSRSNARRASRGGVSPKAIEDLASAYLAIVSSAIESPASAELVDALAKVPPPLEYLVRTAGNPQAKDSFFSASEVLRSLQGSRAGRKSAAPDDEIPF